MIHIREMQAADVETMLELRRQWLAEQFDSHITSELERAWFKRCPGNPLAPALVALEGDRIVGYILCALTTHPAMRGTVATIDEVCEANSHRNQDIGIRLVAELQCRLLSSQRDLNAIRTQVYRDDETAKAFWHALGFEHHTLEYIDYLE